MRISDWSSDVCSSDLAATPKASTGDVQANVDATLDLARLASDKGADLVLFPELNISSYAIDDLHLQDAMLSAVETGIERIVAESAELSPVLLCGAPLHRAGQIGRAHV